MQRSIRHSGVLSTNETTQSTTWGQCTVIADCYIHPPRYDYFVAFLPDSFVGLEINCCKPLLLVRKCATAVVKWLHSDRTVDTILGAKKLIYLSMMTYFCLPRAQTDQLEQE